MVGGKFTHSSHEQECLVCLLFLSFKVLKEHLRSEIMNDLGVFDKVMSLYIMYLQC